MLILEDLQWANEGLEILQQLNRLVGHLPLLIVGSYNPHERPTLPEQLPNMNHMLLSRLSVNEMRQLSVSMLGEVGEEEDILTLLQRETEGNAFFLVEVVRTLAEEVGRLSAINARALPTQIFPKGIETIVQRRLSRVSGAMQELLPAAAVAGRQINNRVLHQLIVQLNLNIDLEEWLTECTAAAVVEIHDGTWRFAHDKLRESILSTLSQIEFRDWHKQVALAIEATYGTDPELSASLAYHWRQVGDKVKEQHYCRVAGDYAQQQFINEDAIWHLSRALTLTPAENLMEQYELLLMREQVYHLQGDRQAQQQDLMLLAGLAERLRHEIAVERRAEVSLHLANYAEAIGDYPAAISATVAALKIAKETQNKAEEAASYSLWGKVLLRQGQYKEATQRLQAGLILAHYHQLKHAEADNLRFLGVTVVESGGQLVEAEHFYREALSLYHALQDKQGESTILNNLSVVAYSQRQLEAALGYWEEARQIHHDIGDREGYVRVLSNLSTVYMDLGDYEMSRSHSEEALNICHEIDLRFGQCFNLINLSLVACHLDNEQQAEAYSQSAWEVAQKMDSRPLQGMVLKDRGFFLAETGQLDEADQVYHQALTIWQNLSQSFQILEAQSGLAKVAFLRGDITQAHIHIQPIVTHLQAGHKLDGITRPFHTYLTAYEILQSVRDPFATTLLTQAYSELIEYAKHIEDEPRRHSFLERIPAHRALATLFKLYSPPGSA